MSRDATASIGMTLFLASWAMMFATLFGAYGFLRTGASQWPPFGMPPLPRLLPFANTGVLFFSSACVHQSQKAARLRIKGRASRWMALAAVAGFVFFLLQLLLWAKLRQLGLHIRTGGLYSSVVYVLTGVHAVHVLVGIAALAALSLLLSVRPDKWETAVRLWGMYWHFVLGAWVVLFVLVFLW